MFTTWRSVKIKPAGPGAAGLFAALHAQSFPDPWSEQAFTAFLHLHGAQGLLAWSREVAVGFALVRVAADEAELLTIGVDPAARRRGVGRRLVGAAAQAALAAGAHMLHLEVAVANAPARALYARAGFEVVGRRAGYYGDAGDALTCTLALSPSGIGDAARERV